MTELKKFARDIRITQLKCFKSRGFGHIGGSLSATDCLAALYGKLMRNLDPEHPQNPGRDRFVCSKGHAGPAVYATLALKGYFPMDMLDTLNQPHTSLPSHCDTNLTPGIDATTGSLGQGASVAAGMALGFKLSKKDNDVYLLLGDGECNEGQVWEMALFASAKKLNNLVAFVDRNLKQLDGETEEVLSLGDVAEKFRTFGWHSVEIDGNDPDTIVKAVEDGRKAQADKPLCIVLKTIKGAGIPEIEQTVHNHHINLPTEKADKYIEYLTNQNA